MVSQIDGALVEVENMASSDRVSGTQRHLTVAILLASLALGAGADARGAAGQVSIGVQGDWGGDTDFGIGARAILSLERLLRGLETVASFDYFFPAEHVGAEVAYWEVSTNLVYRINGADRPVTAYAGAGLHVAHLEVSTHVLGVDVSGDETEGGGNLLGGLILNLGRIRPFLEARFELGGGEQFVASVGVRL